MAARQQECSICMDSFKNPKLISCHHSFCLNCLDDYVRANLRNGRFDCPICRTSVELPKGGIVSLQSNFYIDNTVSGEKFACDLCGPKNVACSRCSDCEENLCQTCCYGHEKSKVSRHHKINDLATLDAATKSKIRQRIFCDQHPEDEIRLFCRDCKVLICLMCKVVNHDNHTSRTVADYAAEMKKTLQSKKDECSDKLRRMNDSKAMAEELDRKINDAEREEIKAVEEQHLQLKKVLEQEVANVKGKIKNVYHDLRQQIAVFKKCVEDELVTCYNAQENVQKITNQGTDIDIIKNGPNLEQLISASMSKTDPTHTTYLKNKLFSPAPIYASKLIPLIGIMQDSTDAVSKSMVVKSLADNPYGTAQAGPYGTAQAGPYAGRYAGPYPGTYGSAQAGRYPGTYGSAQAGRYPGAYAGRYPGTYAGRYPGTYGSAQKPYPK